MNSGIYQIRNITNDNVYIGQTINFKNRKNKHFLNLRKNIHDNMYLQNAWNKYGEINFIFEPLLEIEGTQKEIDDIETQMINSISQKTRYNIALYGGAPGKGRQHTPEAIIKISEGNKGENNGMFGRTGDKNPMFGKIHSLETRELMSLQRKGRKHTEESKQLMSEQKKEKIIICLVNITQKKL